MKTNPPLFTPLACLVPVSVCVLALIILVQPRSWGMVGAVFLFAKVVLPIGVVLGLALTAFAMRRDEPRAAQIIGVVTLASIAIPAVCFYVKQGAEEAAESREQMKRPGAPAVRSADSGCNQTASSSSPEPD